MARSILLPIQRAAALADRAKAERRLSDAKAARESLETALDADPHSKDACKRLAALDLEQGRAPALIEWCKQLTGSGVGHARLHAELAQSCRRHQRMGLR